MKHLPATEGRSSPLVALRRQWHLGFYITVLGLVVGLAAGFLLPTSYTAEARLGIGSGELREFQVPGFALASQQLAANYARYVDGQEAQAQLREALGGRAASIESVTASPIPESNIIRIEVTGTDRAVAIEAADEVAKNLMTQINATTEDQAATLLARYNDESVKVTAAQGTRDSAQVALERLRTLNSPQAAIAQAEAAVAQADAALATAQLRQRSTADLYQEQLRAQDQVSSSSLRSVQTAEVTGSSTTSRVQLFGMAGLIIGAGLALAVAVLRDARAVRRVQPVRAEPETDQVQTPTSGIGMRSSR